MSEVKYIFTAAGHKEVSKAFGQIAKDGTKSFQTLKKELDSYLNHYKSFGQKINGIDKDLNEKRVKAFKESSQKIKAAIRDEISEYRKLSGAAKSSSRSASAGVAGGVGGKPKSAWSKAGGMALDAAKTAIVGAAAGSAALVGAGSREVISLQEQATRLLIGSRQSGKEVGGGKMDASSMSSMVQQTAIANPGTKSEDIMAGLQEFVTRTGDLEMAVKLMDTLATTSAATGTSMADLAGTAADLMQKFDIKTVRDMEKSLTQLTFQGKQGAFELKDAAKEYASIAAAAQRFNIGTGTNAVATLGGLTQIARTTNSSASEAGTSVENFFNKLIQKSTDIKEDYGVSVYDSKGAGRNILELIPELIAKAGNDADGKTNLENKKAALLQTFDLEAVKAISPLQSTYEKAYTDTTGSESEKVAAGMKAVREQLEGAIKATSDFKEIQKDAAIAAQTSSAQFSTAWEELKAGLGKEFVPGLVKLVPDMIKLGKSVLPAILTTFTAIIEAGQLLADGLELLGFSMGAKGPSLEKQREKAATDLEKAQKNIADKQAAGEEVTEADYLAEEEAQAKWDAADAQIDALQSELRNPNKRITREEYIQQQQKSGMMAGSSIKLGSEYDEIMARPYDESQNPLTSGISNAIDGIFYTAEQKALREKVREQAITGLTSTDANINAEYKNNIKNASNPLLALEKEKQTPLIAMDAFGKNLDTLNTKLKETNQNWSSQPMSNRE